MPSALAVAETIAELRPGMAVAALHARLYYCQGFALAWRAHPLFGETMVTGPGGPVTEVDQAQQRSLTRPSLSESDLRVVTAVLGFFADRDDTWLEALVRREALVRAAREGEALSLHDLASHFAVVEDESRLSEPLKRGYDLVVQTPLDEIDAFLSPHARPDPALERWLLGGSR